MSRGRGAGAGGRHPTRRSRGETLRFDEFGFALAKRKDRQVHRRCHVYSYPHLSSLRVKELCELLSYWNGASFICRSQIERFIRMGIPPNLRGRVWKCLLSTDSLRESSDFNYQKCLSEMRGPLVDLGVSEYGILSAIATLSDTQNDLGVNHQQPSNCPEPCYSVDDITLFRQIALDLQRSFPTHRSLMGESPEAIEGQAKLFRVLTAYAKYNPQIRYSQGMSYIAAVLLMQLGEEEAFWALAALLNKPQYLAELFDLSFTKVQHQVEVFDQFLKHRKPKLSRHMESVGVCSVLFAMPWFLTLFTSLPCWDSVLAVWDLIILHGLSAVFRTALTIIELLEPQLMDLTDEGEVLPLLLRVPVDVAQYTVLVPALWNTVVEDWELKCMNSLVLDESHHGPTAEYCERQKATMSCQIRGGKEEENVSAPSEGEKNNEKESVAGAKSVLIRVMRLAQRYLLVSVGRQRAEEKSAQTLVVPRQQSPAPGQILRNRASASLTKAQLPSPCQSFLHLQIRSRTPSQQKGRAQQLLIQGTSGDGTVTDTAGCGKSDKSEQTFKREGTGPVGKVAHHHSNSSSIVNSLRLLPIRKNTVNQTPPSSPVLPLSLNFSTLAILSSIPSSSPPSTNAKRATQAGKTHPGWLSSRG